jgi:orotidine-5'-phosphate decarboxylase
VTQAKDRVIIPLDVDSSERAADIILQLAGSVGYFKVGLELLMAAGAVTMIRQIHDAGAKVFIDGKFSDIPNTVAGATKLVTDMGADMFDVHVNCGRPGLLAATRNKGDAIALAVTMLTSLGERDSDELYGKTVQGVVKRFALMAAESGADGLVCSAQELGMLNRQPGLSHLLLVTPGIRPEWAEVGDQKRTISPREAIASGADLLVVGRPVTAPPAHVGTPRNAVKLLIEEIEAGFEERS